MGGDYSIKFDSLNRSNRSVLAKDRYELHSRKSLNEGLTSALSQDKGLDLILQEVVEIMKNLKSNLADARSLSEALHRSVLCASIAKDAPHTRKSN